LWSNLTPVALYEAVEEAGRYPSRPKGCSGCLRHFRRLGSGYSSTPVSAFLGVAGVPASVALAVVQDGASRTYRSGTGLGHNTPYRGVVSRCLGATCPTVSGCVSVSRDSRNCSWADRTSPCWRTAVLHVGGQQFSILTSQSATAMSPSASSSASVTGSLQWGHEPPGPTRPMKVAHSVQYCSPTALVPQVSHS
jgi:hypothetical protein